jgi:hypothetical protein
MSTICFLYFINSACSFPDIFIKILKETLGIQVNRKRPYSRDWYALWEAVTLSLIGDKKDYLFLSKILTGPQIRHHISKDSESIRTKCLLPWITRNFQIFSLWFYIFRCPWCLFISVKRSTKVWLIIIIVIKSNINVSRYFNPLRTCFVKEFWNILFTRYRYLDWCCH